jgi:hypothetical protein
LTLPKPSNPMAKDFMSVTASIASAVPSLRNLGKDPRNDAFLILMGQRLMRVIRFHGQSVRRDQKPEGHVPECTGKLIFSAANFRGRPSKGTIV